MNISDLALSIPTDKIWFHIIPVVSGYGWVLFDNRTVMACSLHSYSTHYEAYYTGKKARILYIKGISKWGRPWRRRGRWTVPL